MKQISNKKYEAYQQYQTDMLEMLAKFRSEGLFNVVVEDETDDDPGNGE